MMFFKETLISKYNRNNYVHYCINNSYLIINLHTLSEVSQWLTTLDRILIILIIL